MVVYRFGTDDLLRTRFAISPLMEISGGFEALREPENFAVHRLWASWAAPRATGLQTDLLDAAIPRDGRWYPNFVAPPPLVPNAQLDAELERVRTTPTAQVVEEMRRAWPVGPRSPAVRELLEDTPAALDRLAGQMRAFFDAVLAPRWDAVLGVLEGEIAWRARRLAAVGPQAAFAGIHEHVRWAGDALEVRSRDVVELDLAGRGLLFVPAVFTWPDVWPMSDAPWQPAVVYPPRGAATVWEPPACDDGALDDLLGRRRTQILVALDRPRSTSELAGVLGASPAGVSEHLAVLRRAGLVNGRREGRAVLYARTRVGDELVRAATNGPPS